MPILIRDAETRSVLDLEEVGAWQYSTHPSTDVLLYSYCVDNGPIQTWRRGDPPPQEFAWATTEPDWLAGAFNESLRPSCLGSADAPIALSRDCARSNSALAWA